MTADFIRKRMWISILVLFAAVWMMVLGTAQEAYALDGDTVSRYTGKTYKHSSAFANAIMVDGVDVSYVQKNNVDWEKAKADGVDFAIIRVGARGYGEAGKLIEDDYYKQNIEAAQDAGLMVGVYFFSQALNSLEAYAEAAYTLELIEGYELDLPVYMDYEFSGGSDGRLTNAQLSRLHMTENAEMFCNTIEEAGYKAGFYANRNFLNNTVNGKAIGEQWPVWLASYDTFTDYSGNYHMWQYSSSGYVDGYSSRLDVNFMYLEESVEASSILSLAEAEVSLDQSYYTYSYGAVHEPDVSVTFYGSDLKEGTDYKKFYLRNGNAGTAYVLLKGIGYYTDYQLVPFTVESSTNVYGIHVEQPADCHYTGEPTDPADLTVTDAYGNKLVKGLDYTYTVEDSIYMGTANVTVELIGNYSGTKYTSYNILPPENPELDPRPIQKIVTNADSYTKKRLAKSFFLGAVSEAGTAVSYTSSDTSVVKVREDGCVTVMGPGKAEILITAPETEKFQAGEKRVSITVKDMEQAAYQALYQKTKAGIEKTRIVSLTAYPERKKVKLTWNKSNSGFALDYYQVWRSLKKSSGYKKIYTTATSDKKFYMNSKGLSPGTVYWYKVRGVRNLEGKLVYTPFAKVQVTTKK